MNLKEGFKILTWIGSAATGREVEYTATGSHAPEASGSHSWEFVNSQGETLWLDEDSTHLPSFRMSYLEKVLAEGFWVSSESPKVVVSDKPGDYAFDIKFEFKDGKWTIAGAG